MKVQKSYLLKPLGLAALLLALPACEMTPEEIQAMQDAFYTDPPEGIAPPVDVQPACFLERFVQPEAQITRKIDLLFVGDTSGSLVEERTGIAAGIDGFVAALPPEVDYQIGVMMGHSSRSQWSGRLYKTSSREPLVLKSSELSLTDIRSKLSRKLSNGVDDQYADGGEENFYSLWRGLDADRLAESRAAGFFREDAALAVIFVSDENEICSDFPAGVIPVRDDQGIEPVAKARDCAGINPTTMLAKLKAFQGDRPLLVGGITYNRLGHVPAGGENEFGYGYSDIIAQAHGVSVDLADAHYQEGLHEIGTLATIRMQLIVDYTLARTEIDTDSLQVDVDGLNSAFQYNSGDNVVHLDEPGRSLSVVDIHYCMKAELPADPAGGEEPGDGGGTGETTAPGTGGGTTDPGTGGGTTGGTGGLPGGGTGSGQVEPGDGTGGTGGTGGGNQCTGLDCGIFGV